MKISQDDVNRLESKPNDYRKVFIIWLIIMVFFICFLIWGQPLIRNIMERNPKGNPTTVAKYWEKKGRMDMVHLYRGFGYAEENKLKEAIAEYDQSLQAGLKSSSIPDHIHPVRDYNEYGTQLFNSSDYKNSLSVFQRTLQFEPKNDLAIFYISQNYFHLGQTTTAIRYGLKAYQLNPKSPYYSEPLAYIYYSNKQYQESIQYAKIAMENDPKSADAYHIAGLSYIESGDVDNAIEIYKKGLIVNPENLSILKSIGVAYVQKNDFDSAYTYWNQAAKSHPEDGDIHLYSGQYWMHKKDWNKAIAEFQKTEKINQDNRASKLIAECQKNLKGQ